MPGIAELEGGIGLRIIDVAPGHSRGITLDPGELVSGDIGTFQVHIKGDYRVEMEVLRARSAIRPPQPLTLERRLARPGTFLVEQGKDNQQTIVHRARDTWIHRTPVLVNAEGKLYLERVRWPRIHLIPFDDMDALVKALEQMTSDPDRLTRRLRCA